MTFYNGLSSETATNGDARLRTAGVAGSYDTVGGTGLIMPLLDSPGSGGKQLQNSEMISNTGMLIPKWTQYLTDSMHQYNVFSSSSAYQYGDGTALKNWNYGGTGIDTHHTWSVALSASPLSTGSKEAYGLYVSLEYL